MLLAISQSVRSHLLQNQQAGQCALKRAGGLDGAQGLDCADKGAALGYTERDVENDLYSLGSHSDTTKRSSGRPAGDLAVSITP